MDNFLDDESICKLCLNLMNDEYFIIDSLIVQKLQAFCSNESSTIKFTLLKDFLMCYTCSKLLQKLDNLLYKDSKTIQRKNTILVENKHSLGNYSEINLSSSLRYPENACNVCCGFIIDKYHVISNDGIQMFDNLGVSVSSGSKVCQECFDSIYELNNFKVAFIDIQNFIRAYCETFDISNESELNLSHVKFCKTYSHHLDQLDACSEDNSIKIEENDLEESNAENFNIYSSVVEDLENHLKYHDEFHEKVEYGSSECAYKSESLESQKNHSACHIEEDIDSDQYSFKSTMNSKYNSFVNFLTKDFHNSAPKNQDIITRLII
ncbi:unnamed protein product [Phaedon cochleariae]|uniref:Uncharacterized protein n=1 Tax=Phaedon cochleariae TaxID=80249 RepID=A0A9N9SAW9_PHACE|nr:unnamed protein product [Phaedon cochleariae]